MKQPDVLFTEYLRGYDWDSWISTMLDHYGEDSLTANVLGKWEAASNRALLDNRAAMFVCEWN